MSKRYIDADEALRMMRNSKQDNPCNPPNKGVWEIAHDCCISCLDATPTADVAEVRHGEWILEKEPNGKPYCFHCSVCDDEFRRIEIKTKTPYCPHCGAKMDGKRREENE